MKMFISIKSSYEEMNPIAAALSAVAEINVTTEIVELAEEAGVVVTNDIRDALGFLKDYEKVQVVVVLPPGRDRMAAEAGVNSLAKAYPGRVYARPMLEREGEQNIVFFLINISEELK